jgi:hypothetical protein
MIVCSKTAKSETNQITASLRTATQPPQSHRSCPLQCIPLFKTPCSAKNSPSHRLLWMWIQGFPRTPKKHIRRRSSISAFSVSRPNIRLSASNHPSEPSYWMQDINCSLTQCLLEKGSPLPTIINMPLNLISNMDRWAAVTHLPQVTL